MKIFIINLERRKDKLDRIKERIEKIKNKEEIKIIKAVDGIKINDEYLNNNNYKIHNKWRDKNHKRPIKLGEIGCSLSHYKIWKRIVEENIEFAIILEDDAVFSDNYNEKINEITKSIDFDMLYLGRKVFNKNEEEVNENMVKSNFSYWTIGYILTNKGAKKLINSHFEKNIIPVDEYLPYMYGKNNIIDYNLINLDNEEERLISYALKENIIYPENNAFQESDTEISKVYQNEDCDKILVLSVATYITDCYKRFIESLENFNLKYKILGMNNKRYSMESVGGGFKIKLLKEFLEGNEIEDDILIIFTDCFDVIFNDNGDNIIKKYKKIIDRERKEGRDNYILFSTEVNCWPDLNLSKDYPKVDTKYKYLNSGGFIGYKRDILQLIDTDIDELEDDQLYYTQQFLEKENIKLDYKCEIFQTLNNSVEDITLNINRSELVNKYTKTSPSIIHGNGPSKLNLNLIANYIPNRWSEIYGYMMKDHKFIIKDNVNIAIYSNKINKKNVKYKKSNIIYFTNEINYDEDDNKRLYVLKSRDTEIENRLNVLEIIKNMKEIENIGYVLFVDDEHRLENIDIENLIKHDKEIIAPLLVRKNTLFSNFWGAINNDGYYARSEDYFEIAKSNRKGVWSVPYIQNTYLFKIEIIDEIINGYKLNKRMDMDMRLCKYLRDNNYLMYVDNLENYGYIK
jgi:GR25 family glycosyltransferase involved in LPS biosynthesis